MKCFLLLTLGVMNAMAQAPSQVRTEAGARQVYILPMAGGLDQYLATWLTREHVMQVVTDPKAADVILTDRIGEGFEQKLRELYPEEKKKKDADDKTPTESGSGAPHSGFRTSGSRGTLFLVDTKSRQVVWSDYEKPVEPSDAHLNREAERIVKKLGPAPAK
jgi:hypothetical protein